ncbi:FtsK/SpoIIIE domain-containing protein [Haloferula sp. A504]|uniref:FtsK/SpoIIIE domain-containing protein n=1 Tax=Haloferula sp. A504 TaxID=3373601 RepID=UPI0031C1B321|nr:ATP-binding protein [Verrucomicrobiaceae bacterium E54]
MTTASNPLNPAEVLGKLDALKHAIEAAARGERLADEARTARVVAARREMREQEEQLAMEHERRRTELEGRHARERDAAEARHVARLERIEACYHSARRALTNEVTGARDSRVGQVQGEMMLQQEELKERYDRAQSELLGLRAAAEEDLAKATEMADEARKSLRGFKPLVSAKLGGRGVKVGEALEGDLLSEAALDLEVVQRLPLAKFFRFVPLTALLVLAIGLSAWLSGSPGDFSKWWPMAAIAGGAVLVFYAVALATVWGAMQRLAESLQRVRLTGAMGVNAMIGRVRGLKEEIDAETEQLRGGLSEMMRESDSILQDEMRRGREKLEAQFARLPGVEEGLHQRRLERVARAHSQRLAALEEEQGRSLEELKASLQAKIAEADAGHDQALAEVAANWPEEVGRRIERLAALIDERASRFPEWSREWLESWQPPESGESAIPFGSLTVPLAELAEETPGDARFSLPESIALPLALGFPGQGSLLFEGDATEAAGAIHSVVLRLLGHFPPGRVAFTFIDAVGLGRDHAGLMHLADYEDTLIHGRIWTQSAQIEERLAELNEHVEKVIQMYLRNEYATITEYNEKAGAIAEKYQFVVISGLPAGFSDTAMGRLRSLAASGARCGVFLLIQLEKPLADPALEAELRQTCLCLKQEDGVWRIAGRPGTVVLDRAPEDSLETELVHRFGKASVDSNRIEVPFNSIAPEGEWWCEETGDELRVPIGRTGARKLQQLAIGKGTRQHALIAGKTGSGKSTLFHVMITNLALHCSPEEVEFYLVDFKKGVEFKCYGTRRLPHARVVAIESDRQFGLSVLHRVDEELRRRGELFREHGVQDVAGYRRATGGKLPRTLLMIDEFQEFFTEDDGIGQEASLLLDRIVRQGRAFGIHAILGSQTLGGAYTLARATLGQMVIRIALQCNEADAYLIMDDDNPAPRLLTRPGEGIYNDNAGALAANSPFQTVWLSEEERNERLDEVAALARKRGIAMPAPVVFEGNAPADLKENDRLAAVLAEPPVEKPKAGRIWLGAPNSIKGPTEAVLRRQSGSNLLVVGQGEDRMKALMSAALVSLSAQYPAGSARFVVLDPEGEGGDLAAMLKTLPQEGEVHQPGDLAGVMAKLAARLEAGGEDEVFVFIRDLQRFKALREEEDFGFSFDEPSAGAASPAKVFRELIGEGAPAGIHLIVGVDTWNNVGRWIPRKSMADFQMRVLYQMSANDSSAMIDSPAAGNLGLHRALLYDESQGTLETFRPYSRISPGEI